MTLCINTWRTCEVAEHMTHTCYTHARLGGAVGVSSAAAAAPGVTGCAPVLAGAARAPGPTPTPAPPPASAPESCQVQQSHAGASVTRRALLRPATRDALAAQHTPEQAASCLRRT